MALLPNQTWIGVLGGGQLGRMLSLEARRMGYRVAQWAGGPDSGSATVSDWVIEEPFDCEIAFESFLKRADVVTVEFENIPSPLLRSLAEQVSLHPSANAVEIAQNREREKLFLESKSVPCVPFAVIENQIDLALSNSNLPGEKRVLKTAQFGYDGKGQIAFQKSDDTREVWEKMRTPRAVLEQKVDLAGELSVLVARNSSGQTAVYDAAENIHANHILDFSIIPARFPEEVAKQAETIALEICLHLNYVGVLAVEFFLTTTDELLVNEIAPRPHNSGHYTLDGSYTSQFEQQLRAVCDLPLGDTGLKGPTVMWNILGDIWPAHGEPDWGQVFSQPGAALHLYGKKEARVGRKMGHVNFTGENDVDSLLDRARRLAQVLKSQAN